VTTFARRYPCDAAAEVVVFELDIVATIIDCASARLFA
jgi:hypothetical protein